MSFFFSGMLVLKMPKKLRELLRKMLKISLQIIFCAVVGLNLLETILPAKVRLISQECLIFGSNLQFLVLLSLSKCHIATHYP